MEKYAEKDKTTLQSLGDTANGLHCGKTSGAKTVTALHSGRKRKRGNSTFP
jgi:hypothetical protein